MSKEGFQVEPGVLYVVATPIGNLGDISARAMQVITQVDWLACEDTRMTQRLCHALLIRPRGKMISCHEHNEAHRATMLLDALRAGSSVALVSDAGTPGCSDPGFQIVSHMRAANIPIVPIPGPVAFISALVASGLPMDRFMFIGFLPTKAGKRRSELEAHATVTCTLCLYESPKRLVALLQDIQTVLGDRTICVARELTKLHEEIVTGRCSEILADYSARESIRGELVVVIEGAPRQVEVDAGEREAARILVERLRKHNVAPGTIKAIVAEQYKLSKKEVYTMMLAMK